MSAETSEVEGVFQAAFIPKKRPAPASVSDNMVAYIATYPPLGQVTQFPESAVTFTAVLEVPQEIAGELWELALWHSGTQEKGQEWTEATFVPSNKDLHSASLHESSNGLAPLYFTTAPLDVGSSLSFTVKFRQGPSHEWRWLRDEQGLGDGIVIVDKASVQESDAEDLPSLIHGLNPELRWKSRMSQCPNTRLWSIEASVDGAKGDAEDITSTFVDIPLGVPWGSFVRWFALARLWHPWLAPRHGKSTFALDKDAMLCSFLSAKGKHLVLLGVTGDNVATLFRSDDSGQVIIRLRNDSLDAGTGTVLVAIGDDFESANAAVMYHARSLGTPSAAPSEESEIRPNWYEDWYEGLGYCTWNGLGQRLTHEKVLNALGTLSGAGINISSLIVDDNWQDIDYRGSGQWQYGWNGFEAEPKTFPKGLKGLVSEIRQKHGNIQHIAVWHNLLGYWAGLAPEGGLAKKYKTVNVVREDVDPGNLPIDATMTVVAKEDVSRFYNDFYQFLSDCGVDGVKTDGQYLLDTLTSAKARRDLVYPYFQAWMLASLRHFSNKVISCMSEFPQSIFNSQLPNNRPAMVVRNSDDFFPEVASSHPWHVWSNAYNSLLTQHLNIVPDWDMFQTVHAYSGFHAAARCVSGGPVYITDVPGEHNVDLIKQMTGVTTRGKIVVFRPSVVGRAIDPYVNYDDLSLLKVGAYHGRAATGTPLMGIFNISSQTLTELVHISRFSGVVHNTRYIVRSHQSGKVSPPLQVGSASSLVTVSLAVEGYDILSAFPLNKFEGKSGNSVEVANLGLLGKMSGCAAILSTRFEVMENGRLLVDTTLKALGVLGVYISTLPKLSAEGDFMVTIQGQPIPPHTVSVDEVDGRVLRVDIEKAWKEMGLRSGWANEVEVKVYFPLK